MIDSIYRKGRDAIGLDGDSNLLASSRLVSFGHDAATALPCLRLEPRKLPDGLLNYHFRHTFEVKLFNHPGRSVGKVKKTKIFGIACHAMPCRISVRLLLTVGKRSCSLPPPPFPKRKNRSAIDNRIAS